MNKKKKQEGGKLAAVPALIALAVVFLMNVADGEAIVPIIIILFVAGLIAAAVSAAKKNAAGKTAQPRPAAAAQRRAPTAAPARSEQAIHCAHSRGKEKYIEQLDGFLANGIIDRAEYNLMKARYSKLEIEDDYH